jgi:hypothetical protein
MLVVVEVLVVFCITAPKLQKHQMEVRRELYLVKPIQ